MDSCIFCKIVSGTIPSFKIYEDNDYLAILDISQFTEGHTLIIPKKHVRFVWDIGQNKYFEIVSKIANHYRGLGYEFVDSATFGRLVPHAHTHLIPHNGEDNDWKKALTQVGIIQQDPNRRPSKEKGEAILKKFALPISL
ncbi:HIT domain-containing protein [bacterium]|nr:HIT domain-containing protein [bacterium]